MQMLSAPGAPVGEWLDAALLRVSRRSYDGTPIDPTALDALEVLAARLGDMPVARVAVVREVPPGLFSGIVGSYGRVTGAPSALVFIGTVGRPGANEMVGYRGEAYVLEATRLGLGTCWIAGSFKPDVAARSVDLRAGERVFGISPLGMPSVSLSLAERTIFGMKATASKSRKLLGDIASGHETWPAWARAGIEAARLAPSAMNRQPWRFAYADGRITISYKGMDAYKRVSKRLDCGIAMLHFEIAARHAGVAGEWDLLGDGRDVARFRPV